MRVEITYRNGLVEIYSTTSEAGLSSDVIAGNGLAGFEMGDKAVMTLLRPRFDLIDREGLRIDMMWYSARADARTPKTIVPEFFGMGEENALPELTLEGFRVCRLLGVDDLEDVQKVDVDGKWVFERYDGVLVNTTRFNEQYDFWCGETSNKDGSFPTKVLELHEKIRSMHPDWVDEEIEASYGYPRGTWKRSLDQASATEDAGEGLVERQQVALVRQLRQRNPHMSMWQIDALINPEGQKRSMTPEQFEKVWGKAGDGLPEPTGSRLRSSDDIYGYLDIEKPEAEEVLEPETDQDLLSLLNTPAGRRGLEG